MKLFNGVLVTFNVNCINVIDYKLMTVKQQLPDVNNSFFNMKKCIFDYNPILNKLLFYSNANGTTLIEFDIDIEKKEIKKIDSPNIENSQKVINDIDMNKFVIARATNQGDIQLYNLSDIKANPVSKLFI